MAAHVEHFGGLDVMVANAGIAMTAPLLETTAEQWQLIMDVNLGVFHCYQSAARQMITQGEAVGSSVPPRCAAHHRGGSGRARTPLQIRRTRLEPIGRAGTRSAPDHGQRL